MLSIRKIWRGEPRLPFLQSAEVFEFEGTVAFVPVILIGGKQKRGDTENLMVIQLSEPDEAIGRTMSNVLRNSREVDRSSAVPPKAGSIEPIIADTLAVANSGNFFSQVRYCQIIKDDDRFSTYPSIAGALHSSLPTQISEGDDPRGLGAMVRSALALCKLDGGDT